MGTAEKLLPALGAEFCNCPTAEMGASLKSGGIPGAVWCFVVISKTANDRTTDPNTILVFIIPHLRGIVVMESITHLILRVKGPKVA